MRIPFGKLTVLYKALRFPRDPVVFHLALWVPLAAHPSLLQGWVPLPLDFKAVSHNLWSEVLSQ